MRPTQLQGDARGGRGAFLPPRGAALQGEAREAADRHSRKWWRKRSRVVVVSLRAGTKPSLPGVGQEPPPSKTPGDVRARKIGNDCAEHDQHESTEVFASFARSPGL